MSPMCRKVEHRAILRRSAPKTMTDRSVCWRCYKPSSFMDQPEVPRPRGTDSDHAKCVLSHCESVAIALGRL